MWWLSWFKANAPWNRGCRPSLTTVILAHPALIHSSSTSSWRYQALPLKTLWARRSRSSVLETDPSGFKYETSKPVFGRRSSLGSRESLTCRCGRNKKDRSKLWRAVTRWLYVCMVALWIVDMARRGLRVVEVAATKAAKRTQSRQKRKAVVAMDARGGGTV